ncbi:TBC1 domain family member 31 [Bombyx mandarina]|uniref:TBC1 domain family member 31 n=1 Tax=Bombyx mandarina TaxID=7092 RepID=A0A6J2KR29_BOMMA|nr:TBC1 domain family member 31 [Bombyx mandarina]
MELSRIEKFDIKLKSKPKDGVILQLHHTVRSSSGESHRIRFTRGAFSDNNEKLACSDTAGNVFIIDFSDLKFWKLNGVGPCTCLQFENSKHDNLVVAASKNFEINFFDIETGKSNITLNGHTNTVKHISFSNKKANNLLTASQAEAILWEMSNFTKYFTLNTFVGAQIQEIMFTPGGDYLVACFKNDTIQIWKNETMKSVKQIIPSELKHMKSIAFTMNGRAMAMAGLSPVLILFNMDTWTTIKSINMTKYNILGAHQVAFIPQVFDGGANKILAILNSVCTLSFLNLETLGIIYTIKLDSSGIKRFAVSQTGKYFLCILELGEVNIYNSSQVLETVPNKTIKTEKREIPCISCVKSLSPKHSISKSKIEQKMRTCMDSARLRRILMQYGEYPDKFRSVIWRSLLNTPRNRTAYSALVDKGIHPSYRNIEEQFTIHSSTTLKNLKRLLSCLAHWCPLFGVIKFLPGFVFPFVKVLQKDPLLLFECVATILLNYCQLWFEYAPFPPISVLAMIENTLAEHDPQLLKHFCETGVTSQTYALQILETAFSEVLTCTEWLILWDHILSNEPSFILMAVVSYNIVQRNAIKKFKTCEQFENFYHLQNPLDKKTFLKKTYLIMNDTSTDIHPRKYLNNFAPLEKGMCYQQFTGYPKTTICLKLANRDVNKSKPTDKNTLKELTVKSQEREIRDGMKSNSNMSYDSTKEARGENVIDRENRKSHKKSEKNHCSTKDELVTSILQPAGIQIEKDKLHSNEATVSKTGRHSRQKTRKKSANYDLENEVERLLETQSRSDRSAK